MPWNVMEIILQNTDVKTKLIMRKVCHKLRNQVDTHRHTVKRIVLSLWNNQLNLELDSLSIYYAQHVDGSTVCKWRIPEKIRPTLVKGNANFINRCVLDLMSLLQNKKLFVEEFFLNMNCTAHDAVFQRNQSEVLYNFFLFFSAFSHKFQFERVKLLFHGSTEDLQCVIPFCKPGVLKTIAIEGSGILNLTHFSEMEQWKCAQELFVESYKVRTQVEQWIHFKDVRLRIPHFTVEDLQKVVQKIKARPFKNCRYEIHFEMGNNRPFQTFLEETRDEFLTESNFHLNLTLVHGSVTLHFREKFSIREPDVLLNVSS